jgi:hypothetical protein
MAVVSFYTGEDTAKDLVLWPAYGETDFSRAKYESMAPLNRGVLIVKPTLWNGKAGGRIEAFIRDFSQLRPVYEETKTTETAQVQETQGENREAI